MQAVILRNSNLLYKCPNCGHHSIPVVAGRKVEGSWEWNGDLVSPTISPSVLHSYPASFYAEHPNAPKYICHYFIRNGCIQFCDDCTHDKRGQTIPLEQFSDAEVKLNEHDA